MIENVKYRDQKLKKHYKMLYDLDEEVVGKEKI